MTNLLPHIEEGSLTQYIPPKGEFHHFSSDEEYAEKWAEWGLGGKTPKKELWYKEKNQQCLVTIKGYEIHGTHNTLVIEFQDGNLSCIHPAFLKEMQSNTFGKEMENPSESLEATEKPKVAKPSKPKTTNPVTPKKEPAEKKATAPKLTLPEEKVHFTAKVQEFTTKYNHFSDKDEEVVLYADVQIVGENELTLGAAWSSKSKAIDKMELVVGDLIEFDAKVVDNKKFNQEIVYKINNPSKIIKK